jgi:hypothetical protein
MKKLLLVAAVLSLGSVVSADMQVVITENTGPLTPAGYESFVISYVGADASEALSAFDGTINGTLLQAWWVGKNIDKTTYEGYFWVTEPASIAADSHLLVDVSDPAQVLEASKIDEDAVLGTALTPDLYTVGLGTYMATTAISNMAFAIPVAFQTATTELFQVVTPVGQVAVLNGTAVSFNGGSVVHVNTPIPEPATMGLLVIGGIGALIRRRRR